MTEQPLFVLVHSPLVGPATWAWVRDDLERRGVAVVAPSLLGVVNAPRPRWRYCVDVVASAAREWGAVVLVGHSGAGPLLPAIGEALAPASVQYIFVDAGLPAPPGEARLVPPEFRQQLRALAIDGVLPRWSEWWGPEAMRSLVPDDARREAIEAELPRLPLDYFDDAIATPAGWAAQSGYLLFSDAYKAEAEAARAHGWVVERLDGGHLHMAVAPGIVAERLLAIDGRALGDSTTVSPNSDR